MQVGKLGEGNRTESRRRIRTGLYVQSIDYLTREESHYLYLEGRTQSEN
jgi:hypothetical protein